MSADRACSSRSSLQPFLQKKGKITINLSRSYLLKFPSRSSVILACHSLLLSLFIVFRFVPKKREILRLRLYLSTARCITETSKLLGGDGGISYLAMNYRPILEEYQYSGTDKTAWNYSNRRYVPCKMFLVQSISAHLIRS